VSHFGKEAVLAVIRGNTFLGEGSLAGQPVRRGTALALTACTVLPIEKAQVIRVIRDEPSFSEMFIAHLLSRNIRFEEDLVDQLFNSSEQRLARMLLLLANFGKEGKSELIIPNVSQETLARMVGTTRSRVSSFMNKFRRLGFIHYNGGLEVHTSVMNVVVNGSGDAEGKRANSKQSSDS
jgi:CRP-like cAMP-binding protein